MLDIYLKNKNSILISTRNYTKVGARMPNALRARPCNFNCTRKTTQQTKPIWTDPIPYPHRTTPSTEPSPIIGKWTHRLEFQENQDTKASDK